MAERAETEAYYCSTGATRWLLARVWDRARGCFAPPPPTPPG